MMVFIIKLLGESELKIIRKKKLKRKIGYEKTKQKRQRIKESYEILEGKDEIDEIGEVQQDDE
jgi:hypothetical protein